MAFARDTCGRCGNPLVFTNEDGLDVATADVNRVERRQRFLAKWAIWLWAGLGVAVLVAAFALYQPGRARKDLSLDAALGALKEQDEVVAPPVSVSGEATVTELAPAVSSPTDPEEALSAHLAALERQPTDARILNDTGQLLVVLGRAEEAVPYFERALAVSPGNAAYRFNRARALGLGSQAERAEREFRGLAGDTPDDHRVFHNLGLVQRKLGRLNAAVESFRRAVELAPGEAPALYGLGLSLGDLGRGPEAAAVFERYLTLAPDAPEREQIQLRIAQLKARD